MPSFLFTWSHCHLQSEAIPESLKNMLLVMDTAEIFHNADARGGSPSALWEITWERIDCFLPHLRDELFKQTVIQGRRLSSTLLKRVPIKESRAKNQFSVLPSVGRLMGSQGYARKEALRAAIWFFCPSQTPCQWSHMPKNLWPQPT